MKRRFVNCGNPLDKCKIVSPVKEYMVCNFIILVTILYVCLYTCLYMGKRFLGEWMKLYGPVRFEFVGLSTFSITLLAEVMSSVH